MVVSVDRGGKEKKVEVMVVVVGCEVVIRYLVFFSLQSEEGLE